jgi:hypothetical protein
LSTAAEAGSADAVVADDADEAGIADVCAVVDGSAWFRPGFDFELEPPHPASAAQLKAVPRTATI